MKIIKNKYNVPPETHKIVPDIIKVECEECESELEVSKEDTYIGWLGAAYIKCPCCGHEFMVDEFDGITLTKDNLEFPTHFCRTNKDMRCVKEIYPNEIVKEIQRGIDYFRKNKQEYSWYTHYGDLYIAIYKYDGDEEYWVVVSKDTYETNIPFEGEDYE